MRVKILGTRGKIEATAPRHIRHSGILVDDKILFDVGEKTFLRRKPEHIFFTHLHSDHAWFIETNEVFDVDIPVYSPELHPLIKDCSLMNCPVLINHYRITPIPTVHSMKVKSQGYLIESEGKRIFYSSDMVTIESRYHYLLANLDAVITDGSFIRKGGTVRQKEGQVFGHNGIPDLIRFFEPFTRHIIFTHFGTWFMEDPKESKKKILAFKKENLKVDVAYDGKEYVF